VLSDRVVNMGKNIGIIGGGNMGEALIKGLAEKKLFAAADILVSEADAKRRQYLKKKYKVSISDLAELTQQCGIIILAVKPQDMANVLAPINGQNKLFISIAAGLTTQFFEQHLGGRARVARAMPNMPALIGEGITGICKGKYATPTDIKTANQILSAIGQVIIVKESMMDAVTAVSGSGPAYVFLFVEQWMAAAKSLGLSDKDAKNLVYETLNGSAHLLKKIDFSAADLRAKVTSKGGTTQAAMDVFSKAKFGELMKKALSAAKKRAKELSK
jgi:pyrroline-5-carboxylate reductase